MYFIDSEDFTTTRTGPKYDPDYKINRKRIKQLKKTA